MAPTYGSCLLSMAVLSLASHAAPSSLETSYTSQQPLESAPTQAPDVICICSINVSDGRSLECRHYANDSPELLYMSKRNVLLREPVCDGVTSLTVRQPKRIFQLSPGRLLQMKGLKSLRLHQVGLSSKFQPDALRGLVALIELELVGPHSLSRLEAHSFQHTPSLKRLVLQDNGIQIIDRFAFCEADKLEYLDLSRNRIVAYSCDWFPGLSRLTFLNVTLLTGLGKSDSIGSDGPDTDPPDCLFCPLAGIVQLSFNAWDLDTSRGAQALRYAVNRHYQLALQGPLLYNVTGLRSHGACGGAGGAEALAAWQQCQRWQDGKPVAARYVTLPATTSTTAGTAASTTVDSAKLEEQYLSGAEFRPTVTVRVLNSTDEDLTASMEPDKTSSPVIRDLLLLGSPEFLILLAIGVLVFLIILTVICVACCCANRRRVRYSVKAANEAAAAAAAAAAASGTNNANETNGKV